MIHFFKNSLLIKKFFNFKIEYNITSRSIISRGLGASTFSSGSYNGNPSFFISVSRKPFKEKFYFYFYFIQK
jgi:hypothetical protein